MTDLDEWKKFYEKYINSAETLASSGEDIVCLENCHLAVEGIVKACMVSDSSVDSPPSHHRTVDMLKDLNVFRGSRSISDDQRKLVKSLYAAYDRRYPSDLSLNNDLSSDEAVERTKKLKDYLFKLYNIDD